MTAVIDDLINRMDAVMCGQQTGAVPLPEFDEPTLAQLRDIVRPVVMDCRVCARYLPTENRCVIPSYCVLGDKFAPLAFEPLWRVAT